MQSMDLCPGTGFASVGKIEFDEAPHKFAVERTALGFRLVLPTKIQLHWSNHALPRPVLAGMTCRISSNDDTGKECEIGVASDSAWYLPGKGGQSFAGNLTWQGDFKALAWVEQHRNGNPATVKIRVEARIAKAIPGTSADDFAHEVCTIPQQVTGTVILKYPSNVWSEMVRTLGVSETILVAIPLPGSRPAPWDTVFKYLAEARESFEKGGDTGWKGAVVAIREGLKTWQTIEKEQLGPGITVDKNIHVLQQRTKQERLHGVRWMLLQAAHLGPHTLAEDWTRDDAVLMLAAFSGLLAERKP